MRLRQRQSHGAAGWSSPVARQAHNLKAAGSNPAPATNLIPTEHKIPSQNNYKHSIPKATASGLE